MAEAMVLAGVDEVGRGAIFGPVVAAAVILTETATSNLQNFGVQDSKRLSSKRREALVEPIYDLATDCQIGLATVSEIDRLNILQASLLAMQRAVLKLSPVPDLCRVDGNQRILGLGIAQETIVKGDQIDCAIAAASIIAKVWRDNLVIRLSKQYPDYDLESNKGYGTSQHRLALEKLGLTPHHRRSFRCCQLELPLLST